MIIMELVKKQINTTFIYLNTFTLITISISKTDNLIIKTMMLWMFTLDRIYTDVCVIYMVKFDL